MSQDSKPEIASDLTEQELDTVQGGLSLRQPLLDELIVRPRPLPLRPWPPRPIFIRPVPRPLPDPPPFIDVSPIIR